LHCILNACNNKENKAEVSDSISAEEEEEEEEEIYFGQKLPGLIPELLRLNLDRQLLFLLQT
jgi:hypothetical protein